MTKRFFKPTVKASNSGEPAFFRGWKEWQKGDYVIGEFLSSYESTYRNQTSLNFRVRVLETNFKAVDKETKKSVDLVGKVLVLNSSGKLEKFMDKVTGGMLVEVVYGGKQPGKDGTLYHTFERLEAGVAEEIQSEDGGLDDL